MYRSDQIRLPQTHGEALEVLDLFDKWIKNGCLCIAEIRGMQGCAFFSETLHEPYASAGPKANAQT